MIDAFLAFAHAIITPRPADPLRVDTATLGRPSTTTPPTPPIRARSYPEYLKRSVYVCQAERVFRDGLTHMGFYANSAIQPHVPRIRYREDLVNFTEKGAAVRATGSANDRLISEVIEVLLADGTREEGKQYQVFLLSGPEDRDTVRLGQAITNDTLTASGRPWAWTMGQRYVRRIALASG